MKKSKKNKIQLTAKNTRVFQRKQSVSFAYFNDCPAFFAVKKRIFLLFSLLGTGIIPANAQSLNQSQQHDYCWQGMLGRNIPVLLHYQTYGNITVGDIIYLNTNARQPIPVIGNHRYDDGRFVLNEYTAQGDITGQLVVTQKEDSLIGTWYKPYADTEYSIRLAKKDTLISSQAIKANLDNINGRYAYQYGGKGGAGSWDIQKISPEKIVIKAGSVTHAPGRNLAEIPQDTIGLEGNRFIYKVEDGKDCKIVMKGTFYKNFLLVAYINDNPCPYYFGHNATLEGVFYKIKKQ